MDLQTESAGEFQQARRQLAGGALTLLLLGLRTRALSNSRLLVDDLLPLLVDPLALPLSKLARFPL
ncbi:MAG: hypothetical protein ABI868_05440 [Acidobacteriota bacterium]